MTRLPPAEKLPLAVRKNVRDEWESKKADHEQKLSDLLGEAWTIDINPLALYPYASDGYAKESTGSMISQYVGDACSQIESFISKYGDDGKAEINNTCSAHVLTMDLDEAGKFTYCGCEVSTSGQLVLLFGEGYLGVNIYDALQTENIVRSLNAASEGTLNFISRANIKAEWDGQIGTTQERLGRMLQKEIEVKADFEEIAAKLMSAGSAATGHWKENIGNFARFYIEGLANTLESQKFGEDEMMREGFNEAVEKGVVAFRVVDEGVMKESYNETVIEDGVLYLQTTAPYFGTNVDDAARKIVDLL